MDEKKQDQEKVLTAQSELERAIMIAQIAHKGQIRKYSGKPYLTHCAAVAEEVKDMEPELENLQIVAWLHDVLEDCKDWNPELLIDAGISPENVELVVTLTRLENESYYDMIMRIMENGEASIVKIADLTNNISDLAPCPLKDKYLLAKELLWREWVDGYGTWEAELDPEIKEELEREKNAEEERIHGAAEASS